MSWFVIQEFSESAGWSGMIVPWGELQVIGYTVGCFLAPETCMSIDTLGSSGTWRIVLCPTDACTSVSKLPLWLFWASLSVHDYGWWSMHVAGMKLVHIPTPYNQIPYILSIGLQYEWPLWLKRWWRTGWDWVSTRVLSCLQPALKEYGVIHLPCIVSGCLIQNHFPYTITSIVCRVVRQ